MSILYKWDSKKDEIVTMNRLKRILDEIYFHTGMNEKEINKNLKEKEKILDWMLKNNIDYVDGVGKIVSEYYKDPGSVLDVVKKGKDPNVLLKE